MKKMRNPKTLKWKMVRMLLFGWLLPLLALTLGMIWLVSSMVASQIERTILISANKAVEICDMQLREMVVFSKNASYNTTIRTAYINFKQNNVKSMQQKKKIDDFLSQQYKYDVRILGTMLFFLDEPEEIYYTFNTYRDNNTGNQGYQRKEYFKANMLEKVIEAGGDLDTGILLMEESGHLYLVRNLVDSSFVPYAMIVMELKTQEIFGSLESIWGVTGYEVYIDGKALLGNGIEERFDRERIEWPMGNSAYYNDNQEAFVYKTIRFENQNLAFVAELDSKSLIDETVLLESVFILALFFMLLLIGVVFRFTHTSVTNPISVLIEGAREIALGNYGYQVEVVENSDEFAYLGRAFNTMSAELKYQFETIYKEELALKDANIKALQSQINPHFLNNTLEIINWEARMNGNDKVSGMIEALATMLNATMNRKQRRFVALSEELSYVDAYLYIISNRFGERFKVNRQIDERLLEIPVPMLIIQPIVENAVEHGVEENKQGSVSIRIYGEEGKLYIKVSNDGRLTQEDKEKIQRLLGDSEDKTDEPHVSLGIRNVNKRLKIIYGEECGLTIESDEENRTVSTLIVKLSQEDNSSQ